MSAYLEIVVNGKRHTHMCGNVETLGRDHSNSIQVDGSLVSRNHALIRKLGPSQYYVLDVGSRNGSYINGRRVLTPSLMENGDRITLGNCEITFIHDSESTEIFNSGETQVDMGETLTMSSTDIKTVTILVADIRNFTTFSEVTDVKMMSRFMANWISSLQNHVRQYGGYVDKFIGDCVLAIWEQDDVSKGAFQAIHCASEIQQITDDVSADCQLPEKLQVGCGITTGTVALGVGQDNTVMGDPVNIAFRLEAATRTEKCNLIIHEPTYQHLPTPELFHQIEDIYVKGKKNSLQVLKLSYYDSQQLMRNLSNN